MSAGVRSCPSVITFITIGRTLSVEGISFTCQPFAAQACSTPTPGSPATICWVRTETVATFWMRSMM